MEQTPGATNEIKDDWQLLEAWRGGDRPSGEVLLARYLNVLTRFFRTKVSSPDDIADLISETMLACTRSKDRVRDARAFRAFVFSSAMNMLRRHYRKQAKRKREEGDFAALCRGNANDDRSLTSLVSHQQKGRLLVRALRRIPLEQQIVLELSYVEGLNGPEIAELLGIPKPTVYTRLQRGTEKLRKFVAELAASPRATMSTTDLRGWADRIRDELPI